MSPRPAVPETARTEGPPRGRPPASRTAMLRAALGVFATAEAPRSVTMEAVAAAAGVGKGTVFRAFGDRNGLLDAMVTEQFAAFRTAVADGEGPFGDGAAPVDRVHAFLDELLEFKLANRNLMRAREASTTATDLGSERYRWMHDVLAHWIAQADPISSMSASYAAHALLLMLQMDVLDRLLADGASVGELKRQQARHLRAVLSSDPGQGDAVSSAGKAGRPSGRSRRAAARPE